MGFYFFCPSIQPSENVMAKTKATSIAKKATPAVKKEAALKRPTKRSQPGDEKKNASKTADRQLFLSLFEHSLDAILITNDKQQHVNANPAAYKLLGYTKEELLTITQLTIVNVRFVLQVLVDEKWHNSLIHIQMLELKLSKMILHSLEIFQTASSHPKSQRRSTSFETQTAKWQE